MSPAELLLFVCLRASHFHTFREGQPEVLETQEKRSAKTEI